MLTVKVLKRLKDQSGEELPFYDRYATKIIEAKEVDIYTLLPGALSEVAGVRSDGESFAFFIADSRKPRPEGFSEDVEFWFGAYIENSAGATTEMVRF